MYGKPVSIKTIKSGLPKRIEKFSGSGIKLIWTVGNNKTKRIDIFCERPGVSEEIIYKPYQRWIELWAEE